GGGSGSLKTRYDEFQQTAIEAPTPALIVAGPGSGKTSTLIGRAEYLIDALGVQPEHILALTFSRKAAQEMQERLTLSLQHNTPTPTVSTFHAFCSEMLRTYGGLMRLRPDFTVIDETEGYFLLRQLAGEMQIYHYRNLQAPAYYFPDILKAISRAKDELVTPEQYHQLGQRMLESASEEEAQLSAQKALEVAAIYSLYQEALHARGDTDFGGLIMLAVQLLQAFPEVLYEQRQRFQHILVDEFQDINRASGVLLRLLAGEERKVWVVGDANQAIYGFRGASPANIANFQEDFPGAVVLPLSRNYRSRPDIVHLAESFRWRQLEVGMDIAAAPDHASSNKDVQTGVQTARSTHTETYITLAQAEDVANEFAGLIADIRYKHAQGYAYRDMAILCRTRAWVRKITRALTLADLPVIEKRGILSQQHIKDLLSIVLLLADPSGMGILRAARKDEHPFSQSDIEILLLAAHAERRPLGELIFNDEAPLRMSIEGRHTLSHLAKILQSLARFASNVWSLLAQYLFVETSIMRDLLINAKNRLESAAATGAVNSQEAPLLSDYLAFLQLARRYDQQQEALRQRLEQAAEERGEQVGPPPRIQEQLKGFLDYLNVLARLGQDGGDNRDNRRQGVEENDVEEPDIIRVMTVHASKGLEFPVVYLPGLIQRNFPLQTKGNPVPTPLGMVPAASEGKAAHESGESCLFYVGVTRARDHLVLSYSERNGKQKARATSYLEALLAGLTEERITRLQWRGMVEEAIDVDEQEEERPFPSAQPSQDFLRAVKPTTLKSSNIETYQRCPRKYMYSTIYGFRNEEDAYQLFWQATQKTLESLQKHLSEANGQGANALTQEEAQNLYSQHWQELGGPAFPFAALYERHGHEVAALLHGKLLASGATNWQLRRELTVEAAGKTIHLTIDRVEAPEPDKPGVTPARFMRTRFAKRKEKPTAGTRELLYAQAYRQLHAGRPVELHFHNLSTGETFPISLTAKKEQTLYDELEQCIQALERDEFPAKPDSFLCPICPFFLICPA
ncbi:MAG: ATP-dependent helicase, partial [Chloroflexota bacterium]|nr:ATP-dependent helicase [Chloroflexota bacterium]